MHILRENDFSFGATHSLTQIKEKIIQNIPDLPKPGLHLHRRTTLSRQQKKMKESNPTFLAS